MLSNLSYIYSALIVSLLSVVLLILEKGLRDKHNRIFLVFSFTMLLSEAAEVYTIGALNQTIDLSRDQYLIANGAYYFTHILSVILFFAYSVTITGLDMNVKKRRILFSLAIVPGLIAFTLVSVTAFTRYRLIFNVDKDMNYYREPLVIVVYICAALYLIYTLFIIYSYRNIIPLRKIRGLLMFILLLIVGSIIQFFVPNVYPELFYESVGGLALLFSIEDFDENKNGITQVNNRKAFLADNLVIIENKVQCGIISVKLNNIRTFSSSLGVFVTNAILRNVASWLSSAVPEGKIYDCDDGVFAVVIRKNDLQHLDKIEKKITEEFSEDWDFMGLSIYFNTQICVINMPEDVDSIDALTNIIGVDHMKQSKGTITVLKGEDLLFSKRESQVQRAVSEAVRNKTFEAYFQPIYDTQTGKIHSAEALVRMNDPEMGFVSPEEFIPISEKDGDVNEIGEFMFREACRALKEYHLEEMGVEFIEVNLSPVQCMQKGFAEKLLSILDEYELKPSQINLEITETAAVSTPDLFIETLKRLHRYGFRFSLDDYGTGFSNISYIMDYEFSIIKIDKSILWNSENDEEVEAILRHSLGMIKEMGLKIVTEGVETVNQLKYLKQNGCDYCQGYYFSKPVPLNEFVSYVRAMNT